MVDVCVVGSANLDLVATAPRLPGPGETVTGTSFAEHPGGKGLNQAVAAARSGASVAFVGAVGADAAADILRAVLDAERIDVTGLRSAADGVPTGRALVLVDEQAENAIVVVPGANATVTIEDLPAARVLLVQLEIPLAVVTAALAAGRAAGATTVLNPAPAVTLDDDVLALVDVLVPNQHEHDVVLGRPDVPVPPTVLTTRGRDGVDVRQGGRSWHEPAIRVEACDTTGAGDAFCGALAARLAAGDELAAAVHWAAAAGALATTRPGAVPSLPSAAEVRALLAAATGSEP